MGREGYDGPHASLSDRSRSLRVGGDGPLPGVRIELQAVAAV